MKLDYGTQLSPTPIKLSIGTLKKPTLKEISELSFDRFNLYEAFLKMTPERYFTKVKKGEKEESYWNSLSDDAKKVITMFSLIREDEYLQKLYVEIFNFFFIETVVFKEGLFIFLLKQIDSDDDLAMENIRGVVHENSFVDVIELIQQICSIYEKEESMDEMKFKNNTARKIMEKILKGKKQQMEQKKADINLSLPNIISAVSNKHPTINPVNVWDLTIFQLLDSFNRLQVNTMYGINSTRVSVWGDEKKTFDVSLWYKNNYDAK